MEEGLDRDDAYIMVEDEFQAVAINFTQHLHHAEYVRLKNLAKTQNASTINTISRPVDSITTMREETKKKKEAQVQSMKHKNALQQIKAQTGRPKSDDEDSDPDDNKADDPWVGTSLQGLMTSPKKSQTSLTGLGGIKSSTRAAAGFSKAEKRTVQAALPFDLSPKRVLNGVTAKQPQLYDDTSTSGDDDDLDAPAARRPRQAVKSNETPTRRIAMELCAQVRFADVPTERDEDQMSDISSSDNASFPSNSALKSSDAPLLASSASSSKQMAKRMAELKAQKERKDLNAKKKVIQANEIPVFLV